MPRKLTPDLWLFALIVALVVALVAGLVAWQLGRSEPAPRRPNVLVIVLDAVRADFLPWDVKAASDGRFKLIADVHGGLQRLFDLDVDPREQVADSRPKTRVTEAVANVRHAALRVQVVADGIVFEGAVLADAVKVEIHRSVDGAGQHRVLAHPRKENGITTLLRRARDRAADQADADDGDAPELAHLPARKVLRCASTALLPSTVPTEMRR